MDTSDPSSKPSEAAASPPVANLFGSLPPRGHPEEVFEALAQSGDVLVERIVSDGHTSDEWYDQERAEFVTVLSGAADLLFFGDAAPKRLNAGDWCVIPPHCRHKVVWTDDSQQTVWLAVFWNERTPQQQQKPAAANPSA